jgi:shikimate kinase
MNLVFLVGMPGAGKTFWGTRAAKTFGFHFLDLDRYIEQTTQCSVKSIFESYGEAFFRKQEYDCLREVAESCDNNTMIACGGGTPCFWDNMDYMLVKGQVIYLSAGMHYLKKNIMRSSNRPLFTGGADVAQKLETLLQVRANYYSRAHSIIAVEELTEANFEEKFKLCIETH